MKIILIALSTFPIFLGCKPLSKMDSKIESSQDSHPLSQEANRGLMLDQFSGQSTTISDTHQKTVGTYRLKGFTNEIAYQAIKEIGSHHIEEGENLAEFSYFDAWITSPESGEYSSWDKESHHRRSISTRSLVYEINPLSLDNSSKPPATSPKNSQKIHLIYDTNSLELYKNNIAISSLLNWQLPSSSLSSTSLRVTEENQRREDDGYVNFQVKSLDESIQKQLSSVAIEEVLIKLDEMIKNGKIISDKQLGLWNEDQNKYIDAIFFGLQGLKDAQAIDKNEEIKIQAKLAIFQKNYTIGFQQVSTSKQITNLKKYAIEGSQWLHEQSKITQILELKSLFQGFLKKALTPEGKLTSITDNKKIIEIDKLYDSIYDKAASIVLALEKKFKNQENILVKIRQLDHSKTLVASLILQIKHIYLTNQKPIVPLQFNTSLQYTEVIRTSNFPKIKNTKNIIDNLNSDSFNQNNQFVAILHEIQSDLSAFNYIKAQINKDDIKKNLWIEEYKEFKTFRNHVVTKQQENYLEKINNIEAINIMKKSLKSDSNKVLEWELSQGMISEISLPRFYSMD